MTEKTLKKLNQVKSLWFEGKNDVQIAVEMGISSSYVQELRANKLNLPKHSKLGTHKKCLDCKNIFPIENFYWANKKRNAKEARCKKCALNKQQQKKRKNKKWHNASFYENFDYSKKKKCSRCLELKDHTEFYKTPSNPDGFRTYCKTCVANSSNIKKKLINATKRSAKLKNLEHSISFSDIRLPEFCPILEVPINYIKSGFKYENNFYSPSVDRIDNSKGYVKGNVIVVSKLANIMKNSASFKEIRAFAKNTLKLINHYETQGALGDVTDIFPKFKEFKET